VDENVYEIGLEYFTQYDESGKVTKAGKTFEAKETPETVGVLVQKTDSESGNVVKGAGFAVFKDAACTQRVLMNGDTGAEVPVFYYDEDLDGAASEKFVKQQDVYYVKEVVVPDGYRDDGKVWEVKPDYGSFDTVEMTNTPIRCDVSVDKKDKETSDPQGDARLSGATYGLYALETVNYPDGRGIVSYAGNDNITSTVGTDFYSTGTPANAGTLLATVKTDEAGNFNFGNLYYGKYYIQEIEPSEGYLLDETKYEVDYSKEPNTHQNISVTRHVVETVKKQPFEIIKVSTDGDDTETDYVEGAEFTVKLQSEIDKVGWDAAKVYDTLVTDEKGYACSKELPYGTYLVKETKVPHNLYKTDDFTVEVTEDSRTPQRYRILNDAPFKAYIRMVKKDAESGNTICLSGVTFKIRNTDTDEYVEQKVGKDKVSEFTTDDSGTITTPLKLKYGNYQVEEITAPDGYLISEEEFPFVVEKDGAVKVEEDSDGDPVIEVVIQDTPVKGSISITKAGEVLTGTEYDTIVDRIMSAIDQEDRSLDFIYEEQNLAGAVFQLIAAEDIYTPDHQKDESGKRTLEMINGVPASAGAVVATLTTDENGEASMEDLPLGKYQIVEIEAPKGFVLCEEPFPVELTYKDDHTDVVYGNADFVNERVKTKLSVIKTDGVTKNPVEGATYGVFAKEDILDVNGEVAVKADTMVDTAVTTASGQAIFAADLPLANYYVKEVESPEGYVMDDTVYDVDFTYKDPLTAVLEKEITVEETPIIVEVSKTDITTGKELKGATLEVIDSDGEVYASWVTDGKPHQLEAIPAGDYTLKETASPYGYLIANEVEFTVEETGEIQKVAMSDERVKGAIKIYKTDSKTKSPIKGVEFELRNKDGKVLAKLITDKKGYAKTDLLDIGTYDEEGNFEKDIPYYVVETKAAKGYVIDTTPHEVLLQYDDSAVENVVYTLKLKNKPEKPKLPQTGGDYKPWLFGVAGGFLVGAGIYLNRRRKRRKV
jgi:LPXTG-motif cell wall-anchored protein